MYFVLYDRHFNSIGETYILESWSRTQRAVDFDDLRIVGEQIPYSAEPFFVVVNDRQGKQQFSGLASTPQINDKSKKTTIILKDYTTLWNTDIMFSTYGNLGYATKLSEYINGALFFWTDQTDIGIDNISWDVTDLEDIALDDVSLFAPNTLYSLDLYEFINNSLVYYNCYCIPELSVETKTLTYRFYKASTQHRSLRLKDFGIPKIEKSFGSCTRASVYYPDKNSIVSSWAITEDNWMVKLPSDSPLVYPAKNKNFIAELPTDELSIEQSIWNATYEAVMELSNNRYQENIDLDLNDIRGLINLEDVDFSFNISVYAENGLYKNLPVGEIETDSKGKHIIRLGRRIQELTQE